MKKRYKAYFKLNLMSLFFLAISFVSITLAWFAYSGLAKSSTDIKVKSWYIEFEKDKKNVSNDIIISIPDIKPGMEPVNEQIDIKNLGDSDAQVNYSITSARIFDDNLDIKSYEVGQLEDKLSHEYPFHININLNKEYVKAKDDLSTLNVSVTWPLDSGLDEEDSKWGREAFNFQKKEESASKTDNSYQVRSSIKLLITLKAEQYITSNDNVDMNYNLGDSILYDINNNKLCKELSSTCIKTHIIDVNNKIGEPSVSLLPEVYSTYQTGTHSSYNGIINNWNATTRPLEAKDLLKIISTSISDSYLVRENLSDTVVGNMNYKNRTELELEKVKTQNGYYRFSNTKFPYLATNKCYWLKEEYDGETSFAFTKIDDSTSKIYKEANSTTCSMIPVIIAPKSSLYS